MIRSIKYFLIISLLLSITIASTINGVGNYLLDEKVVQPYLDSQLVRLSAVIQILSHSAHIDKETKTAVINYLRSYQPITHQKFVFQAWDQHGNLIINSHNNPANEPLALKDAKFGFSDRKIGQDSWRIYAAYDKDRHIKVVIAELYNIRRQLADDIARNNAYILLVTYPIFGILVWLMIDYALASITRVADAISNRASTYLEPVSMIDIPKEIKPLVAELNQLFLRLKLAFERNKRFASDAAHELRTPLAALKTNLQVALKTQNESERQGAFQKVLESVDRSSHVVAQLLTLSRLGEEEGLADIKPFDLHKLATEIIAYLAPHAIEKNIELELLDPPKNSIITGNEVSIGILIRNVVDNAIRYTPELGSVQIAVLEQANKIVFRVIDSGMGVPVELRERIFERFYRVLGTNTSGSGLGLAIVSQIAKLHHAKITLSTPKSGVGLQFEVAFPHHQA